jgi:hypothetical protein
MRDRREGVGALILLSTSLDGEYTPRKFIPIDEDFYAIGAHCQLSSL